MKISHALFAVTTFVTAAFAQSAPCFETAFGTNLALGDDQVSFANPLGFTFNGLGGSFTDIDISSNGFIYLGTSASNGSGCCSGNESMFLSGNPSVAAYWMDLYPPGSVTGGVFFNTFPASPGVSARAVITWYQVPEYSANPAITAQIQLLDTGEIFIHHDLNNPVPSHIALVGVTSGLNATPNPISFSSIGGGGINTGTVSSAYQEFSMPPNYDIMGNTFWFIPNGQGGYIITSICPPPARADYSNFGVACPLPPVVYEEFQPATFDLSNQSFLFTPNGSGGWAVIPSTNPFFTGFTNNIGAGDDTVAANVALPFTFNHPAGATNSIDISSNGFLWLASNPFGSGCCSGDVVNFLADLPRIAGCWMDQYPPGGGAVYADADPTNQAFYVTWNNVPEFGNATNISTFQIALFANGSFELRYQGVGNGNHVALVGYSTGNGALDPGNRDLSSTVPFSTGSGGIPLGLQVTLTGDRPILGTTFNQDVTNIPAASPIAFLLLGFQGYGPNGIDLTSIGMPGCFQWASINNVQVYLASGPTTTAGLPIPNNAALGGVVLFNQAAAFSPTANAMGIIASNGARLRLGM